MLSAAIFTTSPLLAMGEDLLEDKGKRSLHTLCSSCEPKLMPNASITTGKGLLGNFIDDSIIEILHKLPYNTVLALSNTSKIMNYFCQSPVIWENIAKKENIKLNPLSCTIDQVKYFYTLFNNIDKEFTVTISQLQAFKQKPISCERSPVDKFGTAGLRVTFSNDLPKSWCFSRGKSEFEIHHSSYPHYLETLDENTSITFSCFKNLFPNPDAHTSQILESYSSYFSGSVWIIKPEYVKNLKFGTPQYKQATLEVEFDENGLIDNHVRNMFFIKKIEPK